MKLDESNLRVSKIGTFYRLNIMMPDGSNNYLHSRNYNLESILIIRDLLLDQEFGSDSLAVVEDGQYFRIHLTVFDINGENYEFHSRKLNLNDAVFERMQLIIT